jgi:hypothetical protein
MKAFTVALLCGTLAACSQTTGPETTTAAYAAPAGKAKPAQTVPASKCDEAVRSQANAQMAGAALGMVGSFAGFAGRGGAIVGHVASTAGNIAADAQARQSQEAIMRECYRHG